jgi:nitrous oxidase accessory protein NosD
VKLADGNAVAVAVLFLVEVIIVEFRSVGVRKDGVGVVITELSKVAETVMLL